MSLFRLIPIITALAMPGAGSVLAESPAQRDAGRQYHEMRTDMVERYYGTFDIDGGGSVIYRVPGICKLIENLGDRQIQIALMTADVWQIRREVEVYKVQGSKVRISPCTPHQLTL